MTNTVPIIEDEHNETCRSSMLTDVNKHSPGNRESDAY